jgi:hypothetical protein
VHAAEDPGVHDFQKPARRNRTRVVESVEAWIKQKSEPVGAESELRRLSSLGKRINILLVKI